MKLPWTRLKDINIFNSEYEQQAVSNRVFNRLLENDKYLDQSISQIKQEAIVIEYASTTELKEFEVSGKAVWTDNIITLSATSDEMFDGIVDDRFSTASGNKILIDSLTSGLSFIDLTHLDVMEKHSNASEIATLAKEELGNYTIANNPFVTVQFLFETYYSFWGWNWTFQKIARYRYKIESGVWIYRGRIINEHGRLYI